MTKRNAGVWIDHPKALMVLMTPAGEPTSLTVSKVEKHPQRSGDSPLKGRYAADQVPADDSRQKAAHRGTQRLLRRSDRGSSECRFVHHFWTGRGQGRAEEAALKRKLRGRVAAVETADKMTDRQIAAKVRGHFSALWARRGPKHGRANAGLRGISPRSTQR